MFPRRPVLCHRQIPLDLDRLRGRYGLRRQFEQMKHFTGIMPDATVRYMWTGAARDVAHLEDQSSVGVSSKAVAAHLGHNAASYNRGVTDVYVGPSESYLFNRRVEADRVDVLAPVVARTNDVEEAFATIRTAFELFYDSNDREEGSLPMNLTEETETDSEVIPDGLNDNIAAPEVSPCSSKDAPIVPKCLLARWVLTDI